jgi:formyl-CoA transferase
VIDRALAGVRVLDVSTLYPAPLLAAFLSDLGADVVKIEPPNGDPLRTIGEAAWRIANRAKRSVIVDTTDPDGLARLRRLTAVADVIVLNQPMAVLERWGCTDEDLTARNPRSVIVHVSAFGTTGPYAGRAGNGTLAEAFIGLPPDLGVPLGDTAGAWQGVVRVLAALYRRDSPGSASAGTGEVVDVSLFESLLPLVAPALAGVDAGHMVRTRLTAADGRSVAISATTKSQVRRLEHVAGTDVAGWVRTRTAIDAVALLNDARVPAVVVNTVADLRADPHVVTRRSVDDVDRSAAPALGDHTAQVVEEWLHE